MKTQVMHAEREATQTKGEATGVVLENHTSDLEAIALMAYFYWEARGCPTDSPDEDWFRAEAELRNRLTSSATA